MVWGQIDLLWTIIFLGIITVILFWSYMIFTDRRPYIPSVSRLSNNVNSKGIFQETVHSNDIDEEDDDDDKENQDESYVSSSETEENTSEEE
jgi:hypothetical protein